MEGRRQRSVRLAQNFLRSRKLVERLVGESSIGPEDVVYEIGAGRGIITAELARRAGKVIAVEKDEGLARRLRERFRGSGNVEVVAKDFLECGIREREFKIFASIPYNATARIVRKVLHDRPNEACLIMQKEAARKFAGLPRETLFSLLAKPRFELRLLRELRRTDFDPVPEVDSVLLRVRRRPSPLLSKDDDAFYGEFVRFGFGRWKRHLRSAYKTVFTYTQWKRLSRDLRFPLDATPTELSFEQWLALYRGYIRLRSGK